MRRTAPIGLLVLLSCVLLLGQGAALHHDHASTAGCLAGLCLDHGAHARAAQTLADDDTCPFCEILGQGRSSTTAPTVVGPARAAHSRTLAPREKGPSAPLLEALRARAPPRPA